MAHIRAALAAVAGKLVPDRLLLHRARRRYKANRKRAFKFHSQALVKARHADHLRSQGGYNATAAPMIDVEVARLHHKASKNHSRAQFWLGQIKALVRRIHKLEARRDKLEAEARKWRKTHGVKIHGNTVTGGTAEQRFRAAVLASVANCSSGKRRNFYSMSGNWDVDYVIVPGEEYGERSDCSSTVTGWCKAAGPPDPNGEDWRAGYTGTLVGQHNGRRLVSHVELKRHGWGYIVYGSGAGHHTEAHIGPGDRTGGHGSAPVDFGVDDLFGDGDFRCYIHDAKEES